MWFMLDDTPIRWTARRWVTAVRLMFELNFSFLQVNFVVPAGVPRAHVSSLGKIYGQVWVIPLKS